MSVKYFMDENNGRVEDNWRTIYRDGDPLSLVEVLCDLTDLQYENDKLKQRIRNLRDLTIRFANKEMREE